MASLADRDGAGAVDERGFYRRGERAAAHFRTSVHASPRYAWALARLLCEVDAGLGRPASAELVDVGAGRGELLSQVLAAIDAGPSDLGRRLRPVAVEVAARPPELPERICWQPEPPDLMPGW